MQADAYLADTRSIHASKYLLLTAIEDALALANHVIASEGLRAPSDYADAFRSLRDAGVIEPELSVHALANEHLRSRKARYLNELR